MRLPALPWALILATGHLCGYGGAANAGALAAATPEPGTAPMTSPRMAEPHELVGEWRISVAGGGGCRAVLAEERLETLNAWRLELRECPPHPLLAGAVGWRPTPNGLAFAGADGLTTLDFESTGAGELTANRGHGVVLRR